MPRYTLCPYYIDENKRSISCEDACRSFASHNKKWKWMDMYCDSWDWMKCPYAMDRSVAYKRFEEGDIMALENNKIEALEKECHRLRTALGRAEKRVERQQKKIDELRATNKSFTNVNETLYAKWRKADQELKSFRDKAGDELSAMAEIYEQRMCYLMDKFAEGFFCESDAATWAEDKEFALVSEYDEELCDRIWKVVFKEDAAHDNQRVSGDDETETQV